MGGTLVGRGKGREDCEEDDEEGDDDDDDDDDDEKDDLGAELAKIPSNFVVAIVVVGAGGLRTPRRASLIHCVR